MENNIASILFARGIMPDDFISYSTYAAVAEIVKENQQLKEEVERLKNWQAEMLEVQKKWDSVHEYVSTHPDCPLGSFVSETALHFLKERDKFKAENLRLRVVNEFLKDNSEK